MYVLFQGWYQLSKKITGLRGIIHVTPNNSLFIDLTCWYIFIQVGTYVTQQGILVHNYITGMLKAVIRKLMMYKIVVKYTHKNVILQTKFYKDVLTASASQSQSPYEVLLNLYSVRYSGVFIQNAIHFSLCEKQI